MVADSFHPLPSGSAEHRALAPLCWSWPPIKASSLPAATDSSLDLDWPAETPTVIQVRTRHEPSAVAWCLSQLTDEERVRAARYRHTETQQQFAWGRSLLRYVVGRLLDCPPPQVPLAYGPRGQPYVDLSRTIQPAALPFTVLGVNISHTSDCVLLALSRSRAVGIDIEQTGRDTNCLGLARRYFAPREVTQLEALPAADQRAAFFRIWTQKEAFIKALGDGLACPLTAFEVAVDPAVPSGVLHCDPQISAARWACRPVLVPDGFAAHVIWQVSE